MKRLLIGVLLVLVAATGIAYGLWHKGESSRAGSYRLARVERGPLSAVVSSTGTLNPVVTVQVGSQISGQVKEIYVDFNSPVKRDQLIARIDPEVFESKVAQARADLEAARSAVEVARSNVRQTRAELERMRATAADASRELDRKKMLVQKNFISASERDKAQTAFEVSREQVHETEAKISVQEAQVQNALALVKQRDAALKQALIDLERTSIRAPVDGTVISRNVDAGQTVAASLQAPTLFTIARDLRAMEVDTSVDEADVGRLRVGQRATFTVDAFPGRSFEGAIQQIRKAPTIQQNVVTYTVVISAENPDLALLPGMTANVRIVTEQHENALKVPNAALRFRPAGSADSGRDGPSAAPPGQGPQVARAFRQRLFSDLKLDESQKSRIEGILEESAGKLAALREMQSESERRKHAERVRNETRSRISDVLKPEQRADYERIIAELFGRASLGRVWVLDAEGRPKPVDVQLGLSDGAATEIKSGTIAEGNEIIVGFAEPPKAGRAQGGPRFPF